MTGNEMFKGAKWVDSPNCEAPVFRKQFTAEKGEKAVITICGLGYFKLYLNGKKVSDDLLVPNASTYSYRSLAELGYPLKDKMDFRTYVMQYDITDYLVNGENTMGIMVGCGYYSQLRGGNEGPVSFGLPKLCYVIEKASGDVLCDKTTLVFDGFITENNLYVGEKHDYTRYPLHFSENCYAGNAFGESREIPTPESDYLLQFGPADKVIESLQPTLIRENNGIRLYDAGINTVGYAVVKCAEKGQTVAVSYAEEIYDDKDHGVPFVKDYQTEVFITDGEDREYIPHFTWHGFRYFRVEGPAEVIRVDVVHSDVAVTSAFESDCEQIDWYYNTYIHTQLCNMHSGVPSDCPHLERLGYTGDGQLCCEAGMMMLDSKDFYRKWLYDIADCQCNETGHVQHTCPCMGGGGGPAGWGGAIFEVPYRYYKAYGDKELLNEFFPRMLRFLDYLESRTDLGLIWHEEEGGWCLGDWCTPGPIQISETYVNTVLTLYHMQMVTEIAGILGREDEIAFLPARMERAAKAIEIAYYSPQSATYCGDIQGASVLALQAGLGNERVEKAVCRKYAKLGEFDTGIIATPALIGWLFEHGHGQIAFDLLSSKKKTSFWNMAVHDATTLWECWDGTRSKNHPMFGASTKYIFLYLLGIRQNTDSAAYEKVTISPVFVDGLNRCKGHITTVKGKIAVSYEKCGTKATVKVFADPAIQCEFVYGDFKAPVCGDAQFTVTV